jgi:hypothetical protein
MKNNRTRNYKNGDAFPGRRNRYACRGSRNRALYEALDIAVGYLVRSGYGLRQASDAAYMHIVPLFNAGERRALMLANRAISAIEKERAEDEKLRAACLAALFREHG